MFLTMIGKGGQIPRSPKRVTGSKTSFISRMFDNARMVDHNLWQT